MPTPLNRRLANRAVSRKEGNRLKPRFLGAPKGVVENLKNDLPKPECPLESAQYLEDPTISMIYMILTSSIPRYC